MTVEVDVPRLLAALGIVAEEKMRGDLWAPCPYPGHPEAEPSWHIDAETGLNHCFGCGRGGGAVDLVMEVVELSDYRAAFGYLRDRGLIGAVAEGVPGVEVRVAAPTPAAGAGIPRGVVLGPMAGWPVLIRDYAVGRGIDEAQAARWGLGAGASGELANRLWLPARRRDGSLASWTARSCDGRDPRYRDPRRGEADRSAVFGEEHWPAACAAAEVVVTEGELNALACERAGAEYVAALGGSRLDPAQVAKVARFARIVFAFDPDRAGRALADALAPAARWREVRVAALPDRVDPCELEQRSGIDALAEALR